eukprot:2118716-Pyramimonas_sp.AAC.1
MRTTPAASYSNLRRQATCPVSSPATPRDWLTSERCPERPPPWSCTRPRPAGIDAGLEAAQPPCHENPGL